MRLELKQQIDDINKKQDLSGEFMLAFIKLALAGSIGPTYYTGPATYFERLGICKLIVAERCVERRLYGQ